MTTPGTGKVLLSTAILLMGCASVSLSGCASVPTIPEIRKSYKERLRDLDDWFFNQISQCRKQPETAQCLHDVRESYLALRAELIRGEEAAVNNLWETELEALKALRERLLGMLPQYPEIRELIEFLEKLIREKEDQGKVDLALRNIDGTPVKTPKTPVTTSQPGGGQNQNSALTLPPTPCISGSLKIDGLVSLERDFVQYDADISLELQLSSCNADGVYNVTPVKGGTIKCATQVGTLYGVVDGDYESKLTLGPGGNGTIELWLLFKPDASPWLNAVSGTNYLKLPIKAQPNRDLVISIDWSHLRQVVPRAYSPLADFDHDGTLTQADYAAFVSAYNMQDILADANIDGVFDQQDIAKFWEVFNYEQSVPR